MATRVEKILSKARLTLADPKKERWDDTTLIALLSEAQEDFCQQTQMLHERADILLTEGDPYFTLPDNCWLLTRVTYDKSVIPLVTHHELDTYSSSRRTADFGTASSTYWETSEGLPEAIIYDRSNALQGKVFPIPCGKEKELQLVDLYGVASNNLVDLYGVTVSLSKSKCVLEHPDEPFGVLTDADGTNFELTCYYLKNPADILELDSTIDTPSMYDIALKFYVVGQAFMNDIDTAYQQKGAAQMMIYERHVQTAKRDSAADFTRAGQFQTTYRNGF